MTDREHADEQEEMKDHPELGAALWAMMSEEGRQKLRALAEQTCSDEGMEPTPENHEDMLRLIVDNTLPHTFLDGIMPREEGTYTIEGASGLRMGLHIRHTE